MRVQSDTGPFPIVPTVEDAWANFRTASTVHKKAARLLALAVLEETEDWAVQSMARRHQDLRVRIENLP